MVSIPRRVRLFIALYESLFKLMSFSIQLESDIADVCDRPKVMSLYLRCFSVTHPNTFSTGNTEHCNIHLEGITLLAVLEDVVDQSGCLTGVAGCARTLVCSQHESLSNNKTPAHNAMRYRNRT